MPAVAVVSPHLHAERLLAVLWLQVAKICNNMLLGISMIGVAEAMNLGLRLGIDKHVLAGIINTRCECGG